MDPGGQALQNKDNGRKREELVTRIKETTYFSFLRLETSQTTHGHNGSSGIGAGRAPDYVCSVNVRPLC